MNSPNAPASTPASPAAGPSTLPPAPEAPNLSRKGKIARLPCDIRTQLNRRLQDGHPAKPLAAWLNSLPKVKAVLKAQFAGQPINEMNLSNWRHGGFQHWLQLQEKLGSLASLVEEAADLSSTGSDLPADLSCFLAADFALTARALLQSAPDPETRWQRLRQLLPAAARLRKDDLRFRSLSLAEEQFRFAQDKALSGVAGLPLLHFLACAGRSPCPPDHPQPSPLKAPKPN